MIPFICEMRLGLLLELNVSILTVGLVLAHPVSDTEG